MHLKLRHIGFFVQKVLGFSPINKNNCVKSSILQTKIGDCLLVLYSAVFSSPFPHRIHKKRLLTITKLYL